MESSLVRLQWQVVPAHTLRVYRRCEKCGSMQRFGCSEKFRLNAHQKRLDVWLIYKCLVCNTTWNCTIFSPINRQQLERELFVRLTDNDRDTAWQYAFDLALLKRNGATIDPALAYTIGGLPYPPSDSRPVELLLQCAYALPLRADTVLAQALGISRSRLEQLVRDDVITCVPVRALHGKLRGTLTITIRSLGRDTRADAAEDVLERAA